MTFLRHIAMFSSYAARVMIGILFVLAGVSKLHDPQGFLIDIYGYQLLSKNTGRIAAGFIPFFEFFLGLALVSMILRKGATLLTSLLLISFLAAQASAVSRGLVVNCGCFGGHFDRMVTRGTIVDTAALLVIFLVSSLGLSPSLEVTPPAPDVSELSG